MALTTVKKFHFQCKQKTSTWCDRQIGFSVLSLDSIPRKISIAYDGYSRPMMKAMKVSYKISFEKYVSKTRNYIFIRLDE